MQFNRKLSRFHTCVITLAFKYIAKVQTQNDLICKSDV